MKTEKEITDIQSQVLNQLINTDDERETLFYKAQVRILSWILSDQDIPVSESKEEEIGGGKQ